MEYVYVWLQMDDCAFFSSFFSDEDVLDTWFSSALFPFSIFGWPDKVRHCLWNWNGILWQQLGSETDTDSKAFTQVWTLVSRTSAVCDLFQIWTKTWCNGSLCSFLFWLGVGGKKTQLRLPVWSGVMIMKQQNEVVFCVIRCFAQWSV